MKKSIFKPIVFGVMFGAAAFFMPFFLIKAIFFFMIISFIFRMFGWRRGGHMGMNYQVLYADKIRSMSEEEYTVFKSNVQQNHCCNHGYNHKSNSRTKSNE